MALNEKGEFVQIASDEDPVEALLRIKKDPSTKNDSGKIYVFRDLHAFFDGGGSQKIIRLIRDIANEFKQKKRTLIMVSPVNKIPKDLERDVTLIEFELPAIQDIKLVLNNLIKSNKKFSMTEEEIDRAAQAAMGQTTGEAEANFSKAIIEKAANRNEMGVSELVLIEKALTIKKSGLLEYYPATETIGDVGGLGNYKKWLQLREKAFTKEAREFGLPIPKGILLCGPPGTGKSLVAKATSNILGIPLIRFDIGKVFGSLVGQSEAQLRSVIQTAEALGSCVMFIDEIEKAFAGMGGSSNDSGTSQRVFGSLLTWFQEKKSPVFVVATVNRIEGLPPELIRKGRFDEIFYVGLPNDRDRAEIVNIHILKNKRDPDKFKIDSIVNVSAGFSGAEIGEAVISGLYAAFAAGRDLTTEDIVKAVKATNPLSKSRSDQIAKMTEWAKLNAVCASIEESKTSAGRQLDL